MAALGLSVSIVAVAAIGRAQTPGAKGNGDAKTSLPKDLLPVPGGEVKLGRLHTDILELAGKASTDPDKRLSLLKLMLPELGQVTKRVDDFFLHRHEVTNEQYLQFVKLGTHRFPYLWWKDGAKEDFESDERRAQITKEFPGLKGAEASVAYWEAHWKDLKYAIPAGQEKYPVTSVSWSDAQAFAGWCGMRLPTEAEWTLAASGPLGASPTPPEYVLGKDKEWGKDWLDKLRLSRLKDRVLRPVGALGDVARGPYGHEDLMGNVWEWCFEQEFNFFSKDAYMKEYEKLRRDKVGADVKMGPDFSGLKRVVKGGSYLSWENPLQFRIGTRGAFGSDQTVEAIGFRLAKSPIPGRDMAKSRIRVEFDPSVVVGKREPQLDDLSAQVGIERYELSADGSLILDYHAVAFVAANHMGDTKGMTADKLGELSREKPIWIGVLIVTQKIETPALEPGMYSVFYREKGIAKEMSQALRLAQQELKRGEKEEKKDDKKDAKKDEKKDDAEAEAAKKTPNDWRKTLDRYGITEAEATAKDGDKIDWLKLKPGELKLSTDKGQFVFKKNSGDFVATLPTSAEFQRKQSHSPATLTTTSRDGKQQLLIKFGVLFQQQQKDYLTFELPLVLAEAADPTMPWRTPEIARFPSNAAPAAGTTNTARDSVKESGK